MRFEIRGANGLADLRVELGRELADPPAIRKRINDDVVAEVELDHAELVGLHVVLGGIITTRKERAEAAAREAAGAAKGGG